jgi:hypothetical protein
MHGLYLLWWVQEKDMSPVLVATVLAAGDLVLFAAELPTGWFADRAGHRASLLVGSSLQVLGMIWCWLGEGLIGLSIASVLVALGDGFRSGADQALLYRTCLALGREADFQRIEARTESIALCVLVTLVLVGGIMVQSAGFAAGWLAETALCAAGIGLAAAMVEPPAQSDHDEVTGAPSAIATTRWFALASAIAPAALIGGAASAMAFMAQTAEALDIVKVTSLVAGLTAAEAMGSAIASRLSPASAITTRRLLAVAVLLVMAAFTLPATVPLVTVALAVIAGIAEPLRAAAIQRVVADNIRARAASAASAMDMIVSTIALPLAGLWRTTRRR